MSKIIQDVNLGANIQKIRKEKGLTQEQVCAQMDCLGRPVVRSTYAQIETGTRNIFVSDLIVLSQIFKVNIDEIFKGIKPINKYEL